MSQGFYGFPNILGLLRGTNLRLTGKAGATAGAGLAGGTISGAPTSGQFDALDVVPAQDGTLWICTAAGSPGTWAQIGATGATGATGAAGANFTVGSIPSVRAYNSGNVALTTSAFTAIGFDTTDYDQGTLTAQHSTSSTTSRLTCRTNGVYAIQGQVTFTSNSSGERAVKVRLNGTTDIGFAPVFLPPPSGDVAILPVSVQYKLVDGDYVELLAFAGASGLNALGGAASTNTTFAMVLVA